MSQLCRICLFVIPPSSTANSVNVYHQTGNSLAIIDLMKECTSIQITDPDELPQFICTSCVTKLNFIYEFRNLVISSDARLKMQLQYYRAHPEDDTTNHSSENSQLKTEEIEIKEETIETPIDKNSYENPIETIVPLAENTMQREVLEDRHTNTVNVPRKDIYKCQQCGETFKMWNSFKRHEMEHTEIKPFSCKYCNKECFTRWTLRLHIESHPKVHSCDKCERKFRTSNDLNKHKEIHRGFKKYQCDICNKGFNFSGGIESHMLVHTGERPFLCDICGETFRLKTGLFRHMRWHGGKKTACTICGKSTTITGLKAHIRTHTGQKPYVCDECGKAFTSSSSLKIHKNTIHFGIKAYTCNVCKKSFSQGSTLTTHMLTHSGEKPFPCTLCSKEFTYKQNLRSHVEKHHKGAAEILISDKPVKGEKVCSE